MGRIFRNCAEAINEIERDISEMGILVKPLSMQNHKITEADGDKYDTLELQNYSFAIMSDRDKDEMVGVCLDWCRSEFMERVSAFKNNPGEAYLLRKEVWEPFLVDGKFDYTYSERINYNMQLKKVIEELKVNPGTRQAIIHIHFPDDVDSVGGIARVPCSMYYQLMIRRGRLDIIYNMRSSDFGTHFKNDIWHALKLREYIAEELDINCGLFYMNVGSLHIYKGYGEHKHVF
jgi:thymidylate synthase